MSKQIVTFGIGQGNPIKNIPALMKVVLAKKEKNKKKPTSIYKKSKKRYYIKDEKGQHYIL